MVRLTLGYAAIVVAVSDFQSITRGNQTLLVVNQPPVEANFVGCQEDGALSFQIDSQIRNVARDDLVRWSSPHANLDNHEVVLIDGSCLVLSASWDRQGSLKLTDEQLLAKTTTLGDISTSRGRLRAVLLNAPAEDLRRTHTLDQFLALRQDDDQLLLTNGDIMRGTLLEIGTSEHHQGLVAFFALHAEVEPYSISVDRIAGLVCGSNTKAATRARLTIGLSDGSLLCAKAMTTNAQSFKIQLECGIEVRGENIRDIVSIQSRGPRHVYLSDLDVTDYRHKPFLTIAWPYERDRNVLGGRLAVDDIIYLKGLGVHASSWLSYDLTQLRPDKTDSSEEGHRRFVAQLAVDDAAGDRGSVVFQVFLEGKDSLQLAYESPVIRGGDTPLPISVALGDAEKIALVAEYGERGDECDYGNWLDARLE